MARVRETEWGTVGLAAAIYAAWGLIVASHDAVAGPVTVAALAVVIAWHGSLQHEVLHGHPFRSARANDALGWPPLALRLPYRAYRRFHLEHHASPALTDPGADGESFYVTAADWRTAGALRRGFMTAHHTMVGRLVLGPPCEVIGVAIGHSRLIRRGDRELARWWMGHLAGVAALLTLVIGVLGFPLWHYLVAGYLAHSLTLVRSYCEHRWVPGAGPRSAMVDAGVFFRILFLNNNLHLTHHAAPATPWYALPRLSRERGDRDLAAAGAGHYSGYGEVLRRYAWRPFDDPVHPTERALTA